jgi:hypothetical protein
MGSKLTGATNYWMKAGATCLSQPLSAAADLYDASGAEVAPTEFVEFTVTMETK